MLRYLLQRLLYTLFLLALLTVVIFIVIQLPPGDYLSTLIARLEQSGDTVSEEMVESLKRQYGLDLALHQRYFKWVTAVLSGNFGFSFDYNQPVRDIIGERLVFTMVISLLSAAFVYMVAIPIGIYSATHQYSIIDYLVSFVGYVGLALPNFMFALILMYIALVHFKSNLTGLFSPEYLDAPWDAARIWDMIKHLPIPVIVVGTSGTAGMIRVMRGTLLDELNKQYVVTARSKGVGETRLLFKYPVRLAINPLVTAFAGLFPTLIGGGAIVAMVLQLPTVGPMMIRAQLTQDTFLAATLLMFLSVLTVVGTSISDILLILVDPRIRMDQATT